MYVQTSIPNHGKTNYSIENQSTKYVKKFVKDVEYGKSKLLKTGIPQIHIAIRIKKNLFKILFISLLSKTRNTISRINLIIFEVSTQGQNERIH